MTSSLERYGDFNFLSASAQSELVAKFETDVQTSPFYQFCNAPPDGWTIASLQARIEMRKGANNKRSRLSDVDGENLAGKPTIQFTAGDMQNVVDDAYIPFPQILSPSAKRTASRASISPPPSSSRKDTLIASLRLEINELRLTGASEQLKNEQHINTLYEKNDDGDDIVRHFQIVDGLESAQLSAS